MRYRYDRIGRLIETIRLAADGEPTESTRYQRDDAGRKTAVHRLHHVDGRIGTPELLVRYEYPGGPPDGLPLPHPVLIGRPSVVPGKEHQFRLRYNEAGQVVQVTESGWRPALDGGMPSAIERTARFGYTRINGRSLLASLDGPLPNGASSSPVDSDISLFAHDDSGNFQTEITAPGRQTIRITQRDRAGRPQEIVAPGGIVLHYQLDPAGRILRLGKAGAADHFRYNALGRLSELTPASGQRIHLAYRSDGRVAALFDLQNNRIRIERDSEGQLQARSLLNPDGSIAQQENLRHPFVDGEAPAALRRIVAGIDEVSDPHGNTTRVLRAADGLPEAVFEPGNLATRMIYDSHRKLAELKDARRLATIYRHDDFGRLLQVASPDSGDTRYEWDAADRLQARTTASGTTDASTTRYRYDAAGRVLEQSSEEGATRIEYGDHGRPVRIRYPAGEEQYRYDRAARLTGHTRIIDGHRFSTGYAYDDQGRLQHKTLPDGQVLRYRYNGAVHPKAGLLQAITRKDLFGQTVLLQGLNDAEDGHSRQRYELAHGIAFQRQLDKEGSISRIGVAGIWEEEHLRDAAGHLALRTPITPAATRGFGYHYDALGRLSGTARTGLLRTDTRATDQQQFRYDDGGNLLARMSPSGTARYAVDSGSNRITAATTEGKVRDYEYNRAGSISRIGNTAYEWDSQQRLIKASRDGKPIAEYRYNPFGERISKTTYSGDQKKLTYYFHDGSQLTAEAEVEQGAARIVRQYVWLQDQAGARPIAMLQSRDSLAGKALGTISPAAGGAVGTDVYAVVADHTGAPRALVDGRKQVAWQAEVTGFGNAVPDERNRQQLHLRGSNQYFDEETGLHYNLRRYLDPDSGRYLSTDPSGQAGGINPYVFANNNPVANVDPLGLQAAPAGSLAGWTLERKLKHVMDRASVQLPNELGDALRSLVSPASIGTTAAILGAWAGAQFTPYGWAADAALVGIGYLMLGSAVVDVTKAIFDTARQINRAQCEPDLDQAGDLLAEGLGSAVAASMGSAGILSAARVAKLARYILGSRGDGAKALSPSGKGSVRPTYLTPAEFAKLPSTGYIDPRSVRYSQDSISGNFRPPHGSIDELVQGLRSGQIDRSLIEPIRVVEHEGKIYTLDNRRLYTFEQAGLDIPYKKLDVLPKSERFKFTTKNDGTSIVLRKGKDNDRR